MATYRILSWREIPTVVKARDPAGRTVSQELPQWFAQEVDRVAMRDGLHGSDAYLEQWSWSDWIDEPGDANLVASSVVERLVSEWADGRGKIRRKASMPNSEV